MYGEHCKLIFPITSFYKSWKESDRLPAVLQTIYSALQIIRASPNWKHGWKIPGALHWIQAFMLQLERAFIQMQNTFLFSLCIKHHSFHYLRKQFAFKIIFFLWTVESKHDDSVSFISAMFFRFDRLVSAYTLPDGITSKSWIINKKMAAWLHYL